jgi:Collagen triple helix repeat (20 copies)
MRFALALILLLSPLGTTRGQTLQMKMVPAGPPGPPGPPGVAGPPGAKGDVGAQGPKGDAGEQGVKGDTGAQGVKGDTGAKGDVGAQGPKGDTGAQGVKGDTGAKGDVGAQGPKGDTGAQGVKGDTGAQGVKGDTGAQGVKGDTGAQGPAVALAVEYRSGFNNCIGVTQSQICNVYSEPCTAGKLPIGIFCRTTGPPGGDGTMGPLEATDEQGKGRCYVQVYSGTVNVGLVVKAACV